MKMQQKVDIYLSKTKASEVKRIDTLILEP